jgi:hypothetical protein
MRPTDSKVGEALAAVKALAAAQADAVREARRLADHSLEAQLDTVADCRRRAADAEEEVDDARALLRELARHLGVGLGIEAPRRRSGGPRDGGDDDDDDNGGNGDGDDDGGDDEDGRDLAETARLVKERVEAVLAKAHVEAVAAETEAAVALAAGEAARAEASERLLEAEAARDEAARALAQLFAAPPAAGSDSSATPAGKGSPASEPSARAVRELRMARALERAGLSAATEGIPRTSSENDLSTTDECSRDPYWLGKKRAHMR